MKSLILLLALLLLPHNLEAQGRTPLANKAVQSIVKVAHPIEKEDGTPSAYICTGIVMPNRVVLTAQHCIGDGVLVNGEPSYLIKVNEELALVALPDGMDIKPAKLAKRVRVGEAVISAGWGENLLMVLQRHVAFFIDGDVAVDGPFVMGMSGGPVTNLKGEVVGIVQRGNDRIGIGCGFAEIADFMKGD